MPSEGDQDGETDEDTSASDNESFPDDAIEGTIEDMWDDPDDRFELWAGFFGKFVYDLGVPAIIFLPVVLIIVGFIALATDASIIALLSLVGVFVLSYSGLSVILFCSFIGRGSD